MGGVVMATAIIGTGNIGGTLARHLVRGGEPVVLAAKDEANAATLAQELGDLARAASVEEAIAEADAVVFAVWLDTIKELTQRTPTSWRAKWWSTPRTRSESTRTAKDLVDTGRHRGDLWHPIGRRPPGAEAGWRGYTRA